VSLFADPREERRVLLELVADGEHPIELRYRVERRDGVHWGKRFADSPAEADEAAARLTGRADVFVGMLPRLGRTGDDQRRYAPARLLWADPDTERSVGRLMMFDPPPTGIVRSGGVDGVTPKRHGYWWLREPLPADEVKRHELRLAHHFESDPAVAEPGRVMRVPGSRSYKTGRVARLEWFTGEVHALDAVTGGLADAPSYVAPGEPRPGRSGDELVALFAGRYGEGERHERFRSVVGVLLRRCGALPPDVLLELAVAWAERHTAPCKDRAELDRQFDHLLDRERRRRGLA
jgi:hypothetical protein